MFISYIGTIFAIKNRVLYDIITFSNVSRCPTLTNHFLYGFVAATLLMALHFLYRSNCPMLITVYVYFERAIYIFILFSSESIMRMFKIWVIKTLHHFKVYTGYVGT